MSFLSKLFHKEASQKALTPEKKAPKPVIEMSPDAMKAALKSSEHLALSILNGLETLTEVITTARIQEDHVAGLSEFLKQTEKTFSNIYKMTEHTQQFAESQVHAMAQSVSSIEQLSGSISAVSDDIGKRLAITKGLSEAAVEGNEKVKKVLDVVKILSENMESIKTLISSINAISAQSNMLAMNAAIEAAHAGQAGRGFSVVADEIRKLSEVTRNNAVNITETVKNTMNALGEVRNTVNKASAAMLWIEEEVTKASESFEAITQNLRELEKDSDVMRKTAQSFDTSESALKTHSDEAKNSLEIVSETMRRFTSVEQNIKQNVSAISRSSMSITGFFQDIISTEGDLQKVLDDAVNAADTFERYETFPFTTMVLKHLMWIARVRGLLDGATKNLEVNVNHHTCDLGKWIDAQNGKPISSLPAFQHLTSVHEELHNMVKAIASQNNAASHQDQEGKYAELLKTSERVIDALTKLRTSIT
ncbi:MAG: methyl-accepting chemotaxis protein [Spirochaetaceae bacterium]|jgi:methyl-accepting chemotaxis protein|nr:methyl-accepting chemotaxis protein [Spirochaetaceae bacterium]